MHLKIYAEHPFEWYDSATIIVQRLQTLAYILWNYILGII